MNDENSGTIPTVGRRRAGGGDGAARGAAMTTRAFWLSFVDEHGFVCACIVEVPADASSPVEAAEQKAIDLGLRPAGCTMFALPVPPRADLPLNMAMNAREAEEFSDLVFGVEHGTA